MQIYEAIYRNEEFEEVVSILSIEAHPEFHEVRKNLYCTYENCKAKLEYVPKGKRKAHFKTWPKQNHVKECIDYFEREKKARSERGSATATMLISDKHISDILNDIKRNRNKKEQITTTGPRTKKEKKNVVIDPSQSPEGGVRVVPTTGSDADDIVLEGKGKEPSVKRKTLSLLSEEDIGMTRALYNVSVDSVDVSNDRVVVTVSDNKKTCSVYFEEFFFSSAPVGFLNRFKRLKEIAELDKSLEFTCVGSVIGRNDSVNILVNKHNAFRIEDKYLTVFLDVYKTK
ncbi:hypothetical protein QWJ34_01275 [Saccharibacillus sp. CPCC 101409]|uniref:hypothetical protein n=1 Tax=Saccharibacillus sp. CPCC 101409 TaxID=3058041 RepID=UPI0026728583|nr:hypothetical protein [Saccharibacillus sp. CPCC 101409]MDO3408392.1 hypothetical protein [Saccharibacillus sp. CPCC 101409]